MRKGLNMSLADAQRHAQKHGYSLEGFVGTGMAAQEAVDAIAGKVVRPRVPPKPVRMTRPEREYRLILEAMKRRGEIVDYRYQGMSLAWGEDPETGRLMRYKCDYLVINAILPCTGVTGPYTVTIGDAEMPWARLTLVETKGPHIYQKDLIRFKGCRAEWPMFKFEMHQLEKGAWRRVE